ncbi:aminoacyltransferase [Mammaliicoccus stepanovicii]|uniref:Aminoacyltransferase FemA n=1 Tax=Mammaliicoccus stepanovicii TaxID=643214 RepID=A0A239YC29_9STAP|nr:aminoacyltransferase [Mammaliicoccus stepanovicii]PNZ75461.1 aminoacyltransferase [Mammaliicoccus stepanovicii]GGI43055.1 methicillin resistance protein [Mammaliicoccus stepanovicii]SNV55728.1 fmhA protein [Mammaliicoccus stepanovicii]
MYFLTLTEEEFDGFIKRNFSHYTQSKNHYAYRNKFKKDVHIVGVKNEQNEVIAATLLTEARSMKFFKYFYTHRGPVLDFNNEELVSFFFKNLTKYLKKQRCLYVLVDPYIVINKYEADGNKINEYEHQKLIEMLEEQGYKHQGYSVGYQPMSQIRWLSVLDLKDKSEQTLLKELNYQTRRNIKKTDEMGVQVNTLKIEETDRFFNLFKMAEEKHGFSFRGIDYFKEMQAIYHDNSVLKVATINLTNYLNQLKNQQTSLSDEMSCIEKNLQENPNSKKQKTLMQNVKQRYDSTAKRIDKVKNLISTDGEVIDLAAALYIYNDYEMYYLSSGSNPKYNEFMGAYKLQWEMIKFSKERGIDRYNFYGVTGDFNDTAEDYGVQQFKKGFNAEVEEYIGDFIKPIKKNWFAVNNILQKIKER